MKPARPVTLEDMGAGYRFRERRDAPWLSICAPERLWLAGEAMSTWESSFAGITAL